MKTDTTRMDLTGQVRTVAVALFTFELDYDCDAIALDYDHNRSIVT